MSRSNVIFILSLILFCFSCKSTKESGSSKQPDKGSGRGKVLSALMVNELSIERLPHYNAVGEKWDAYAPFMENPDIYLTIKWLNNEIYRSVTYEEYWSDSPLAITQSVPFEIKPFDQNMIIEIFDEDGLTADDNMAVFNFLPLDYKNKSEVYLTSQDGRSAVKLTLQWIYK